MNIFSIATNTIENAIAISTQVPCNTKIPSTPKIKVTLCASVNSEICINRGRNVEEDRSSASTKAKWSSPIGRICSMPCLVYNSAVSIGERSNLISGSDEYAALFVERLSSASCAHNSGSISSSLQSSSSGCASAKAQKNESEMPAINLKSGDVLLKYFIWVYKSFATLAQGHKIGHLLLEIKQWASDQRLIF